MLRNEFESFRNSQNIFSSESSQQIPTCISDQNERKSPRGEIRGESGLSVSDIRSVPVLRVSQGLNMPRGCVASNPYKSLSQRIPHAPDAAPPSANSYARHLLMQDLYPEGDELMQAPRVGNGADFNFDAPYRMYHGKRVPGNLPGEKAFALMAVVMQAGLVIVIWTQQLQSCGKFWHSTTMEVRHSASTLRPEHSSLPSLFWHGSFATVEILAGHSQNFTHTLSSTSAGFPQHPHRGFETLTATMEVRQ